MFPNFIANSFGSVNKKYVAKLQMMITTSIDNFIAIGLIYLALNARITCVLQRASLGRKCSADPKKPAVTRQVDPFVRRLIGSGLGHR